MSGIVMFSTFGALNGIVLTGPRVYYSIARDGLLFDWVGEIHPRYRTPHRALCCRRSGRRGWWVLVRSERCSRELFTRSGSFSR